MWKTLKKSYTIQKYHCGKKYMTCVKNVEIVKTFKFFTVCVGNYMFIVENYVETVDNFKKSYSFQQLGNCITKLLQLSVEIDRRFCYDESAFFHWQQMQCFCNICANKEIIEREFLVCG